MKIAIVTGASSGMGREAVIQIADRFSGIGEIWVIARRRERMEELRREVPAPLRIFPLDLAEEDSMRVLRWELQQRRPEVKILVNAAGYGKIGNVGTAGLEEETGMVRINSEALCGVTHLVLPYMTAHSRILMFASAAGVCRLCRNQGLCGQLQPGAERGIKAKGYCGDGGLPGAGGNRIF